MNDIYCFVNDLNLRAQLKRQTNFNIISSLKEIKEKKANLVIFLEAIEDWNAMKLVIKKNYLNNLILIQSRNDGLMVSTFSPDKIGCPRCVNIYSENSFLTGSNSIHVRNLKVVEEMVHKLLYMNMNGYFQYVLNIPESMKVVLRKVLPSIACPNCSKLYERRFPMDTLLPPKKQNRMRKYNDQMISKIVSGIPMGKYSLFSTPEVYKMKGVYLSRVEIKSAKNTYGIGRSFSKEQAINISLLEGLERLSLNGDIGKIDHIMQAYENLPNAIHPYQLIKTPFIFSPSSYYSWVTALKLSSNDQVMIPQQLVLINKEDTLNYRGERRFYSATSHGTAIGGSKMEAAFYAIIEYFERENGLEAWYSRKNLKKWPLKFFEKNEQTRNLINFFKQNSCELHVISTNKMKTISTVWIHLSWNAGQLNVCGAGITPDSAVQSALLELFTGFLNFKTITREQEHRIQYLNRTFQFQSMEDHVLYYLQSKERSQFSFIEDIPYEEEATYLKLERRSEEIQRKGLSGLFDIIKDEVRGLNREIYLVDLTPPIVKVIDLNLSVIKVFMTKSHHFNFGIYDDTRQPHPFL
ncbi:YcaO-like family protein [Virgibacillus sediminis]|uniref:YcaO-like family protein n=1 Tax=Virgibacillus sediminis TaxID=202260 RepID=A0ABV7AAU0_9BACI